MRSRVAAAIAAALILLHAAPGAAEPWRYLLETDLTLTQGFYSDNWEGSEVGDITWVWNMNLLASKQFAANWNNRNTLKLKYGMTHKQDSETKDWAKPQKSDDQIDFETIFRYTGFSTVDPYASFRFESIFYDRSGTGEKLYINPMRFTESAGVAKSLIDREDAQWLIRLGVGARQFVDRGAAGESTITTETRTQHDTGVLFDTDYRFPISGGKVVYSGKLNIYQALINSEKDELAGLPEEDHWRSPDVRWEHTLSTSITGYLAMILYVDFRYDKEIDLGGRFKQTLGLALNYRFGNMEEKEE